MGSDHFPSLESLPQATGPQDNPVPSLSSLLPPFFSNGTLGEQTSTHPERTHAHTYTHRGHCVTEDLQWIVAPRPSKAQTGRSCLLAPFEHLHLVSPAYLSNASSLMPANRFTLWLSGNCFLSSWRHVCKDKSRGDRPVLSDCDVKLYYSLYYLCYCSQAGHCFSKHWLIYRLWTILLM